MEHQLHEGESIIGTDTTPRRLGPPLDQKTVISGAVFAYNAARHAMLVCGFWDNSVKLYDAMSGKHRQSLFSHNEVVTCVAVSPCGSIIVTGSRDAIVLVWFMGQQACANPEPQAVLVGHDQALVDVAVDNSLGVVVSGSSTTCLVHKVSGELLRTLSPPSVLRKLHLVSISTLGNIIVHYRDKAPKPSVHLFSLNGKLLGSVEEEQQLFALATTEDGAHLVTGGLDRTVRVRTLADLSVVTTFDAMESSIRSLCMHSERCVLAGMSSGEIAVLRW